MNILEIGTPVANAQGYCNYGMMPWGGGGFGVVASILFWLVIVILIVYAIKALTSKGGHKMMMGAKEKSALEILEERYAKGEIDKKEFEDKKRDLGF